MLVACNTIINVCHIWKNTKQSCLVRVGGVNKLLRKCCEQTTLQTVNDIFPHQQVGIINSNVLIVHVYMNLPSRRLVQGLPG